MGADYEQLLGALFSSFKGQKSKNLFSVCNTKLNDVNFFFNFFWQKIG
jgi:hypothetical protein